MIEFNDETQNDSDCSEVKENKLQIPKKLPKVSLEAVCNVSIDKDQITVSRI